MLGTGWTEAVALAAAFLIAMLATPAGISGAVHHRGPVAPDWPTGIALGLAGAYTGARIQSRLPDALIRRLVGILVVAIADRYLWSGLA